MTMQINWTKCSEQMPPDDESEIIIRHIQDRALILTPANEVFYDIDAAHIILWEWIPYTQEAWEELGK